MTGAVRRRSGLLMGALLFMNTACYAFVPVATGVNLGSGDYIRVRLNASGTSELAASLGPSVEWAEGTVSERREDGTLLVGVVQVRLRDGLDRFWTGSNAVAIAPGQIAEVQQKTLDKGRSRIGALGLGAALVAIAAIALRAGGAGGDPGDSGTQPPP